MRWSISRFEIRQRRKFLVWKFSCHPIHKVNQGALCSSFALINGLAKIASTASNVVIGCYGPIDSRWIFKHPFLKVSDCMIKNFFIGKTELIRLTLPIIQRVIFRMIFKVNPWWQYFTEGMAPVPPSIFQIM